MDALGVSVFQNRNNVVVARADSPLSSSRLRDFEIRPRLWSRRREETHSNAECETRNRNQRSSAWKPAWSK